MPGQQPDSKSIARKVHYVKWFRQLIRLRYGFASGRYSPVSVPYFVKREEESNSSSAPCSLSHLHPEIVDFEYVVWCIASVTRTTSRNTSTPKNLSAACTVHGHYDAMLAISESARLVSYLAIRTSSTSHRQAAITYFLALYINHNLGSASDKVNPAYHSPEVLYPKLSEPASGRRQPQTGPKPRFLRPPEGFEVISYTRFIDWCM